MITMDTLSADDPSEPYKARALVPSAKEMRAAGLKLALTKALAAINTHADEGAITLSLDDPFRAHVDLELSGAGYHTEIVEGGLYITWRS